MTFWAAPLVLALMAHEPARADDQAAQSGSALRVLSAHDVQRYRSIFAIQEDGRWGAADAVIRRLEDPVLMGHVRAQRLLHPKKYRAPYKELANWLKRYADHPDAPAIHRLALKRKPRGAEAPPAPVLVERPQRPKVAPSARLTGAQVEAAAILRQVRENVRKDRLTASQTLLNGRRARAVMSVEQRDRALSEVAKGWYLWGDNEKALALAEGVIERSGGKLPFAYWTAGLAAWRLGRYDAAAWHFEGLALSQAVDDWNAAAGAFWAARAHLKARRPDAVNLWLALAASMPRTFYGLLAGRALGLELEIAFEPPGLEPAKARRFLTAPAGRRAVALAEVDQPDRARRELQVFADPDKKVPKHADAILALSLQAGLSELSLSLATKLERARRDRPVYAALYPLPRWAPDGGFSVDRALVYAVARQESAFRPKARSRAGARGLMQLMPATAGFIAKDKRLNNGEAARLYEPGLNLELAQRYIHHLLGLEVVGGDLLRLTAAYNGGPGNLARWQARTAHGADPLLFIESLAALETRLYIERVLANLWIYRQRLGQPSPSLEALAAGQWPRYVALDPPRVSLAQTPESAP